MKLFNCLEMRWNIPMSLIWILLILRIRDDGNQISRGTVYHIALHWVVWSAIEKIISLGNFSNSEV